MSVNACRFTTAAVITAILLLTDLQSPSVAEPPRIPVLVPITGFLSLEGTSQRNGAALALEGSGIALEVDDTATSPEVAINAFERTITSGRARDDIVAIVAPMLGTQMLALVPLADEFAVPMITISGTARITELGSPNVFRFFPGDAVVKAAHARYAVRELSATRPAVIFQTTAYGQSGRAELDRNLTGLNAPPVLSEGLDVSVKDMLPV
ncbi:MAG TPA: amino acid ABC transporter substrate-binding protein, partial [Rhodospirillaceae bacterium]|nr:amino acid ABC transporter substrate-binding protein [Rhodospirillaceae bacterium]